MCRLLGGLRLNRLALAKRKLQPDLIVLRLEPLLAFQQVHRGYRLALLVTELLQVMEESIQATAQSSMA